LIDQINREVTLGFKPQRIISLVPSQTELLYDLGLEKEVVGITKFCIHPTDWRQRKTIIGGTKNFRFDVIDSLKPDLIIGNKEENYKEGIEKLATRYPVWISDILTLEDALDMIACVGNITHKQKKADDFISQIKTHFTQLPSFENKKAAYFIWKDPYMVVGQSTFINDILSRLNIINIFENKSRYFEVSIEEIKKLNVDYIFLSSEPFPFKEKNCLEFRNLLIGKSVEIVDGEMFSWYGTRLLHSLTYFKELYAKIVH